ncbi:MAG: hypothetical protein KJ580_04950 [Nanoarchaeota archaeon]|nr:hypothetical protein [Nanoarchaeota archaeon]
MISTTFAKAWFKGENNSNNYEYFPFFIRRISPIYEKQLYQKVITAIKKINSRDITEEEKKKLFSSAFDARLEILFLSGYFNYWSQNDSNQREVMRFILDYLFLINPSDPFGASDSYLPKSEQEIKNLIEIGGIKENNNLIGKLILSLKSVAWATTSETINMAKSIEGPYFIGNLNKFVFIRSYFSIKNPYIWSNSKLYLFDRIDVCTLYERGKSNFGKIDVDFYGNYSSNFNLNNYSKAIVLVDGKQLNTIKEISQLTENLQEIALKQMNNFRSLSTKEQMKKIMELHCKVYKNIFSLAEMDWKPTREMYELIESKELKPKKEKEETYKENDDYDEFTILTLKLLDDANYDQKYSRFCEELSNLSLNAPNGIEFYGGKAVNLGLLKMKKFNVPNGFVITTESFNHFMNRNKLFSQIKELLKEFNVNDTEKLNKVSSQIRKLIVNGVVDESIKKSIMNEFINYNKVSVRSSATTEDLKEASFAGQFDTYLNIDKDNLVEAVKKCWASLFSSRAIYYRMKNDFPIYNVSMAILIQEMIEPEFAGVSFSRSPLNEKEDSILIEASEGLGENVVSGSADPLRIVVSRNLEKINRNKQSESSLSSEQIKELTKLTLEIEKFFGLPQDIEWALKNNNIHILQSRPLTKHLHKKSTKNINFGKPFLKGIPASEGTAKGKVSIINEISELEKFSEGDILVAKTTSPELVVIMSKASGIITQYGGISSHAAIVSRELGIPCIVGCKNLFDKIKNGDKIILNADLGEIYYEK